ncbi:MAG: hypothetical protein R3B70_33850 [Polyangiaceae bacterium]
MPTSLRCALVALLPLTLQLGCADKPPPRAGRPPPPRGMYGSPWQPAPPPPPPVPPPPPPQQQQAPAGPETIVIHEAEMFGELQARAGATVVMLTRVITSRTEPEIGNQGVLSQKVKSASGEIWVEIARVEVKSKMDSDNRITLTIKDEEKRFQQGVYGFPFAPNSKLRLKWEWQ